MRHGKAVDQAAKEVKIVKFNEESALVVAQNCREHAPINPTVSRGSVEMGCWLRCGIRELVLPVLRQQEYLV